MKTVKIEYRDTDLIYYKVTEDLGSYIQFDGTYIDFKRHNMNSAKNADTDIWEDHLQYEEWFIPIERVSTIDLSNNVVEDFVAWRLRLSMIGTSDDIMIYFASHKEANNVFKQVKSWVTEYKQK